VKVKLRKIDIAIHYGGTVSRLLRSPRLIAIERINDGSIITLGGVVIIVSHIIKTE